MSNAFLDQFKRAIRRFGHTQRYIAKLLGIEESSLSRMLNGHRKTVRADLIPVIRKYITYGFIEYPETKTETVTKKLVHGKPAEKEKTKQEHVHEFLDQERDKQLAKEVCFKETYTDIIFTKQGHIITKNIKTVDSTGKNISIGVLAAVPVPIDYTDPNSPTIISIGLSMCNTDVDEFDRHTGYTLAVMRAIKHLEWHKIKNRETKRGSVGLELIYFLNRCMKYYKDKPIIVPKYRIV